MIGDDDFFMQNADYHYGASDAEKMYGRGYNNYNPNSRAGGLLLRPPNLEEQKRNAKHEDGVNFAVGIIGGGGFIVSIIFLLLMSICPSDFAGYLFFGLIISLILLFIIFIWAYRANNIIIDETYDELYNKNSEVNSNRLDVYDKVSYNSKNHTSQSSGDYRGFMDFQAEMDRKDILQAQNDMMDMMDWDFYD